MFTVGSKSTAKDVSDWNKCTILSKWAPAVLMVLPGNPQSMDHEGFGLLSSTNCLKEFLCLSYISKLSTQ